MTTPAGIVGTGGDMETDAIVTGAAFEEQQPSLESSEHDAACQPASRPASSDDSTIITKIDGSASSSKDAVNAVASIVDADSIAMTTTTTTTTTTTASPEEPDKSNKGNTTTSTRKPGIVFTTVWNASSTTSSSNNSSSSSYPTLLRKSWTAAAAAATVASATSSVVGSDGFASTTGPLLMDRLSSWRKESGSVVSMWRKGASNSNSSSNTTTDGNQNKDAATGVAAPEGTMAQPTTTTTNTPGKSRAGRFIVPLVQASLSPSAKQDNPHEMFNEATTPQAANINKSLGRETSLDDTDTSTTITAAPATEQELPMSSAKGQSANHTATLTQEDHLRQGTDQPEGSARGGGVGGGTSSPRSSYDEEDDDYYEEETNSYISSSAYTAESRDSSRVSTLQWAAASVVDSVQAGYFRGRYQSNSTTMSVATQLKIHTSSSNHPLTVSQTARILASPQAAHLQELMQQLEPHQYIMLLGRGMLGVNLKQTFLKQQGVYVDFLVKGGAADNAGVIYVGDSLVTVGNTDVRKGTIATVPATIAAAKRPVHLIFSTSASNMTSNILTSGNYMDRIQYVDVAVAMMHVLLPKSDDAEGSVRSKAGSEGNHSRSLSMRNHSEQGTLSTHQEVDRRGEKQDAATFDNRSKSSDAGSDQVAPMELISPTSFDENHDQGVPDQVHLLNVDFPRNVETLLNPGIPDQMIRQVYAPHVTKRNNEKKAHVDPLVQLAAKNETFRSILQYAFLSCVIDGRRFPYLAKHFSRMEDNMMMALPSVEDAATDLDEAATATSSSGNAMLMMFLEMVNFSDVFGVTSEIRRRQIANRIAYKYFLPTQIGRELVSPMFDFHYIVPVSSLRRLETALNGKEVDLTQDVFFDFQLAVVESLSERPFLTFMVSNECARSRAFLRNTAPFVNVPLSNVLGALTTTATTNSEKYPIYAKNYFLYILVYLLCLTDKEFMGENDDLLEGDSSVSGNNGNRIDEGAGGLCAAVFIHSKLLPIFETVHQSMEESAQSILVELIRMLDRFYELFVARGVGILTFGSHSNDTDDVLEQLRNAFDVLRLRACQSLDLASLVQILDELEFAKKARALADELVYDYAVNAHSKFRVHKIHEWLCEEMLKYSQTEIMEEEKPFVSPIPSGCIKRLLRKADLPVGVASHKPSLLWNNTGDKDGAVSDGKQRNLNAVIQQLNAECAVVFGSTVGLELSAQHPSPALDDTDIRRYACQSLINSEGLGFSSDLDDDDFLAPEHIPSTLESYAVVPPMPRNKPFLKYNMPSRNTWRDSDGWEISLVNFVIPRADSVPEDGEESSLFGVSLVFQRHQEYVNSRLGQSMTFDNLSDADEKKDNPVDSDSQQKTLSAACPTFYHHLMGRSWTDRLYNEVRHDYQSATVGIALVSRRNVILAMRDTLTRLVRDFSSDTAVDGRCSLIQVLGTFSHQDVEPKSLRCLLEPYIRQSVEPWLERPIKAQKEAFLQIAGQHLIRTLPPIPLALLFVTILLEQKVVILSSRRSILFSTATAISELLKPLRWCHLLVPRVPTALAADLMQYPAPYILGMPSEDPGIMDLIRDLPPDVTLVDLDVGRVILAPHFAHDNELGRGRSNTVDTARALRSQVLFLAQSLGAVFGSCLDEETWCCDSPMIVSANQENPPKSQFDILCMVCRDFLQELLAGTTSCCYWIEEAVLDAESTSKAEPTILFDEDRFFNIKSARHLKAFRPIFGGEPPISSHLAPSLDSFDLVVELFMRCQSMNDYIGSTEPANMVFF